PRELRRRARRDAGGGGGGAADSDLGRQWRPRGGARRRLRPVIERLLTVRAGVITLVLWGALAGSAPAVAAPALIRPVRIGVLFPDTPSARAPMLEAFRQGLQELGYVDGQGVILDVRYAENQEERLGPLATELVKESVDLLVAGGTTPTAAAQLATRTIPIVMVGVGDPVARGFVASLRQPGGHITRSSHSRPHPPATRLQLLQGPPPSPAPPPP